MQGFQKCQKKLKKLTFCPSSRAFFVYSIAAYYASQPTLSNTKKHQPNVAQSTSNPPRTVVDLRKYDPRSLDHQNWSTGREIIGFSIHQKIVQYCSKDNFPLNTPKTYQMISNHHLAHSERFCTWKSMIVGLWIIKIGQLGGKLCHFPYIQKSLSSIVRTISLWKPQKPSKFYPIII